jgi:hypothetical protein
MTRTVLLALGLSLLAGCGGGAPHATTTPTEPTAARPQSLEEALSAAGLTRIELPGERLASIAPGTGEPVVENGHVRVHETAGWNASPTVFARRGDGAVVIVTPRPNVIVDRHVDGGCLGFAGGRGWFEDVTYALPAGATFEGSVEVSWDEHTEVVDHTDTQPDGSPCPPPAID